MSKLALVWERIAKTAVDRPAEPEITGRWLHASDRDRTEALERVLHEWDAIEAAAAGLARDAA